MKHSNPKPEVALDIGALSYGPYGIGRINGKAVMIPGTAPGDALIARIIESKGRYDVGQVVRLTALSPQRQTPPCRYAGSCGGCSWQHLRYASQLEAKQRSVDDALRRIGKLDGFKLRPIIPSPDEYRYRRRVRLQCKPDKTLGLFRPFSHELVEIASCDIADLKIERCLPLAREWVGRSSTAVKYLEIVAGDGPGETVMIAGGAAEFSPSDECIAESLLGENQDISGLIVRGSDWRRRWGETFITIAVEDGITLKVEADVFTQVNGAGNRRLLAELLSAAAFDSSDRVLELYSGAGNFTVPMAKRAGEIVAVEASRESIASGERSARLNGIDNIRWIHADVAAALKRLGSDDRSFTKIVLDPPRAGAAGMQAELATLAAKEIFYISCNPATLARDLSALAKYGYKLHWVRPIDLFPHTFHVETLAMAGRAERALP